MPELPTLPVELAWPLVMALAWLIGEFGYREFGLPRISLYGVVGFLVAPGQLGLLPTTVPGLLPLLADIAFGLILFELGTRINLRWWRSNPWLAVISVVEALATYAAVYLVSRAFGAGPVAALLLAALALSTSPAAVVRVVNEERSSGQVTERLLHLSAASCVLAVLLFKMTLGYWVFENTGSVWTALWEGAVVVMISAAVGAALGVLMPALLRRVASEDTDATVAYGLGVIVAVALTHALKLSPVLAALTFGLVVRHRRVVFSQTRRNFGALGNLLTILLFVFVATTIEWNAVTAGFGLALAVILTRLVVKTAGVAAFSSLSGITWRKGVLTGIGLAPLSVFVILLLEQSRHVGIGLVDELVALAGITLVLELAGPVLTQRALQLAGEVPATRED